jgi:hypothetical protein
MTHASVTEPTVQLGISLQCDKIVAVERLTGRKVTKKCGAA